MTAPELAKRTVLVVDDEPTVREVVGAYLTRDGMTVRQAGDGTSALEIVAGEQPDLMVLDVMLPGIDGLSLLKEIRRRSTTPVILLTARDEEADRVLGLELGADDYVVKPFSPRELSARVRAVLKRSNTVSRIPGTTLEFDGVRIDAGSREVWVGDNLVDLTPKEFDLLVFLATFPRQVFSRAQLLDQVWESSPDWQDPSTVTVHIRRLRQKVEDDPDHPRRVTTVWGVGYKFEP